MFLSTLIPVLFLKILNTIFLYQDYTQIFAVQNRTMRFTC